MTVITVRMNRRETDGFIPFILHNKYNWLYHWQLQTWTNVCWAGCTNHIINLNRGRFMSDRHWSDVRFDRKNLCSGKESGICSLLSNEITNKLMQHKTIRHPQQINTFGASLIQLLQINHKTDTQSGHVTSVKIMAVVLYHLFEVIRISMEVT